MFNVFLENLRVCREGSQIQQPDKAWESLALSPAVPTLLRGKRSQQGDFAILLLKLWSCCLNFKWRRLHLKVCILLLQRSWKDKAKLDTYFQMATKVFLLPRRCTASCWPETLLACAPHLCHQYQCVRLWQTLLSSSLRVPPLYTQSLGPREAKWWRGIKTRHDGKHHQLDRV